MSNSSYFWVSPHMKASHDVRNISGTGPAPTFRRLAVIKLSDLLLSLFYSTITHHSMKKRHWKTKPRSEFHMALSTT
jgi:hypothetical protein